MSKNKPLEQCHTWKELEDFAEGHGIPYDHTTGGHRLHKPSNGGRPIPFSTHEKEPSKHLRSQVIKQIKAAMLIIIPCVFLGVWIFGNMVN